MRRGQARRGEEARLRAAERRDERLVEGARPAEQGGEGRQQQRGRHRRGDGRCGVRDGGAGRVHRVAYDHESTMAKIRAVPELPDYLADRLAKGR